MNLYVYMILHGNLSFSSIPTSQYSIVLDTCYWPVLEMVRKGFKLGLEFPAETLEEINKIDPSFISELKKLWEQKKCDFIGSGYTQSVFPLIPFDVNMKNLNLGKSLYKKFFKKAPLMAFLNEMTYSEALPSLYAREGYESIIMDWDNAAEFNDYTDELRYRTAYVRVNGKRISLLWNSSLNSYKFQRCIYNRIPLDEYTRNIISHRSPEFDRSLILYGTDWEMFNYRPVTGEVMRGEVEKIRMILESLLAKPGISLVRPSEVFEKIPPVEEVAISSSECPIPCKNRDDYNVIRWAVSGRDDVQINTQCYRLYNHLKDLEAIDGGSADVSGLWKSLCHLWGSDYRTKTTNEKHYYFRNNMGEKLTRAIMLKEKKIKKIAPKGDFIIMNTTGFPLKNEPVEFVLQFPRGAYKKPSIGIETTKGPLLSQCEEFSLYRDGSIRSVKIVAEASLDAMEKISCRLFEREKKSSSDGLIRIDRDFINIDTPEVYLSLCKATGADIRELIFKNICEKPLIKYLPPVYFDHIGHSHDYYSGWNQYCTGEGQIFNDTMSVTQSFERIDYPIRTPVYFTMELPFGRCLKTVYTYTHWPRVDIRFQFAFFDLNPVYFRAGITTLNPEAFDKESLSFATVNGADMVERFPLTGHRVMHNSPVVPFSSGTTCLGSTEGWVDISDKDKSLAIISDKSDLYSVPMIEYEEINSRYLLRVYNSLSESDETGRVLWRGHDEITFVYYGHNNRIDDIRKKAAAVNRKVLVVSRTGCIK
ncbi:MAG: hypothetical protein JW928_08310 [Candidatus Aureabacteria bacterium]|nr:hypothetical protein [Candidatus Auribacterota bacterium]